MARELKYRPVDTDFQSLERELRGGRDDDPYPSEDDPRDDIPDEYAELAAKYADVDDDLRQSG
ncbi:hypothetical protein GGQ54_001239 [Naumannella cuiyingiana]|uniref:Uncharacterized protein n=1 Tax=Naumannella cuiyingiana TaxID=1347891 RepID=A0A7Z0D847_9ACTN|nr:hypothetical protein [Naumannella cuiyingiana]